MGITAPAAIPSPSRGANQKFGAPHASAPREEVSRRTPRARRLPARSRIRRGRRMMSHCTPRTRRVILFPAADRP